MAEKETKTEVFSLEEAYRQQQEAIKELQSEVQSVKTTSQTNTQRLSTRDIFDKTKSDEEAFAGESLRAQAAWMNARNYNNSKMLEADEKNHAMEVRSAFVAQNNLMFWQTYQQTNQLFNATLANINNKVDTTHQVTEQAVRHADIAIEGQWPDHQEVTEIAALSKLLGVKTSEAKKLLDKTRKDLSE